jgi:hypothetical protein
MRVIIHLSRDTPPQRRAEFGRTAGLIHEIPVPEGEIHPAMYPAWSGADLIRIAGEVSAGSVDHLVLVCHGTPTGFLHPGRGWGVHRWRERPPHLTSINHFSDAWAPVMMTWRLTGDDFVEHVNPLISLCACLCSRSPHWHLTERYGRHVSPWGPESYRDGGEHSIAAALRDAMLRRGVPVMVRGHTAAGHVTDLPLLREHGPIVGDTGHSLFRLALPGVEPTWSARRRWIRLVRGELARRWLLGDDTVVDEIRARWAQ